MSEHSVEASLTLVDLSSGDDGPRGGGVYSAIIQGYEWSDDLAADAVPLGIPVNADVVTLVGSVTIGGEQAFTSFSSWADSDTLESGEWRAYKRGPSNTFPVMEDEDDWSDIHHVKISRAGLPAFPSWLTVGSSEGGTFSGSTSSVTIVLARNGRNFGVYTGRVWADDTDVWIGYDGSGISYSSNSLGDFARGGIDVFFLRSFSSSATISRWSETRFFVANDVSDPSRGGTWVLAMLFIPGNAIIEGSLRADVFVANTIGSKYLKANIITAREANFHSLRSLGLTVDLDADVGGTLSAAHIESNVFNFWPLWSGKVAVSQTSALKTFAFEFDDIPTHLRSRIDAYLICGGASSVNNLAFGSFLIRKVDLYRVASSATAKTYTSGVHGGNLGSSAHFAYVVACLGYPASGDVAGLKIYQADQNQIYGDSDDPGGYITGIWGVGLPD